MPDERPDELTGRLLVARPALSDPFRRTLVLLLQHGPGGALGVVLNRPSETPVAQVLPGWESLASDPAVLHAGGPVQTGAAICVARARPGALRGGVPEGFAPLYGDLGTVDLDADPSALAPVLAELRVYAGYSGWGAGQLEGELDAGAWHLVAPTAGDAFSAEPERLWVRLLRRQPGELAMLSTLPEDPALN